MTDILELLGGCSSCDSLKAKIQDLERKFETKKKLVVTLKEVLRRKDLDEKARKKENDNLVNDEVSIFRNKLRESIASLARCNENVSELRERNKYLEQTVDNLQGVNSYLEKQVQSLIEDRDDHARELKECKSELKKSKNVKRRARLKEKKVRKRSASGDESTSHDVSESEKSDSELAFIETVDVKAAPPQVENRVRTPLIEVPSTVDDKDQSLFVSPVKASSIRNENLVLESFEVKDDDCIKGREYDETLESLCMSPFVTEDEMQWLEDHAIDASSVADHDYCNFEASSVDLTDQKCLSPLHGVEFNESQEVVAQSNRSKQATPLVITEQMDIGHSIEDTCLEIETTCDDIAGIEGADLLDQSSTQLLLRQLEAVDPAVKLAETALPERHESVEDEIVGVSSAQNDSIFASACNRSPQATDPHSADSFRSLFDPSDNCPESIPSHSRSVDVQEAKNRTILNENEKVTPNECDNVSEGTVLRMDYVPSLISPIKQRSYFKKRSVHTTSTAVQTEALPVPSSSSSTTSVGVQVKSSTRNAIIDARVNSSDFGVQVNSENKTNCRVNNSSQTNSIILKTQEVQVDVTVESNLVKDKPPLFCGIFDVKVEDPYKSCSFPHLFKRYSYGVGTLDTARQIFSGNSLFAERPKQFNTGERQSRKRPLLLPSSLRIDSNCDAAPNALKKPRRECQLSELDESDLCSVLTRLNLTDLKRELSICGSCEIQCKPLFGKVEFSPIHSPFRLDQPPRAWGNSSALDSWSGVTDFSEVFAKRRECIPTPAVSFKGYRTSEAARQNVSHATPSALSEIPQEPTAEALADPPEISSTGEREPPSPVKITSTGERETPSPVKITFASKYSGPEQPSNPTKFQEIKFIPSSESRSSTPCELSEQASPNDPHDDRPVAKRTKLIKADPPNCDRVDVNNPPNSQTLEVLPPRNLSYDKAIFEEEAVFKVPSSRPIVVKKGKKKKSTKSSKLVIENDVKHPPPLTNSAEDINIEEVLDFLRAELSFLDVKLLSPLPSISDAEDELDCGNESLANKQFAESTPSDIASEIIGDRPENLLPSGNKKTSGRNLTAGKHFVGETISKTESVAVFASSESEDDGQGTIKNSGDKLKSIENIKAPFSQRTLNSKIRLVRSGTSSRSSPPRLEMCVESVVCLKPEEFVESTPSSVASEIFGDRPENLLPPEGKKTSGCNLIADKLSVAETSLKKEAVAAFASSESEDDGQGTEQNRGDKLKSKKNLEEQQTLNSKIRLVRSGAPPRSEKSSVESEVCLKHEVPVRTRIEDIVVAATESEATSSRKEAKASSLPGQSRSDLAKKSPKARCSKINVAIEQENVVNLSDEVGSSTRLPASPPSSSLKEKSSQESGPVKQTSPAHLEDTAAVTSSTPPGEETIACVLPIAKKPSQMVLNTCLADSSAPIELRNDSNSNEKVDSLTTLPPSSPPLSALKQFSKKSETVCLNIESSPPPTTCPKYSAPAADNTATSSTREEVVAPLRRESHAKLELNQLARFFNRQKPSALQENTTGDGNNLNPTSVDENIEANEEDNNEIFTNYYQEESSDALSDDSEDNLVVDEGIGDIVVVNNVDEDDDDAAAEKDWLSKCGNLNLDLNINTTGFYVECEERGKEKVLGNEEHENEPQGIPTVDPPADGLTPMDLVVHVEPAVDTPVQKPPPEAEEEERIPCELNVLHGSMKYWYQQVADGLVAAAKKPPASSKSMTKIEAKLKDYCSKNSHATPSSTAYNLRVFSHDDVSKSIVKQILKSVPEKDTTISPLRHRLLSLVMALNEREPSFLNQMLDAIAFSVGSINEKTMTADECEKLATFFCQLCQIFRFKGRMVAFIVDIIYTRGSKARPVFFTLLKMWPNLLPHFKYSEGDFLTMAVVMSLCLPSKKGTLTPLQKIIIKCLSENYGYSQIINMDQSRFVDDLLSNLAVKQAETAALLYCKSRGWEFTVELMNAWIFPRLTAWVKGEREFDDLYLSKLIIFQGLVSKNVPVGDTSLLMQKFLFVLEKILNKATNPLVTDATVEAICHFRRHGITECATILRNWTPPNKQLSMKALTRVWDVLRAKPPIFWSRLFSQ